MVREQFPGTKTKSSSEKMSMNILEQIVLCAKIYGVWPKTKELQNNFKKSYMKGLDVYNPIDNDQQAFRLVTSLSLAVNRFETGWVVTPAITSKYSELSERASASECLGTGKTLNEAIVMCAASIQACIEKEKLQREKGKRKGDGVRRGKSKKS